MVTDSKGTGNGYPGGSGGTWRKLECWKCVREHLKTNRLKRAEEIGIEKTQKDEGGEWCIQRAKNKRAIRKTEVK